MTAISPSTPAPVSRSPAAPPPAGPNGAATWDKLISSSNVPVTEKNFLTSLMMQLSAPGADDDPTMTQGLVDTLLSAEQNKASKFGIALSMSQKEEFLAQAKKLFDSAVAKLKEAEAKQAENKDWAYAKAILGVIGGIAGIIGAAVLVATGVGAVAGGFVAAGAVMGLLVAIGDLGTLIAADQGTTFTSPTGKERALQLNFDGLIQQITDQQEADGTLVVIRKNDAGQYINYKGDVITDQNPMWNAKPGALVMEESVFEDYKQGWSVAAMGLMIALSVAGGVMSFRNASKTIDLLDKTAKALNAADKAKKSSVAVQRLEQAAELVGGGVDISSGGVAIKQGQNAIEVADAQKVGDDARNQAQLVEARSNDQQGRWELHLSGMRKRMEAYEENGKRRLEIVGDQHEASQDISRRLSA
ncbi:hypothetical protein [Caenimonas sp. SL110]|uniref:hypothetical protein n=1 Tax=Caenimonas sp. SL110 TaxID=1450524 RepID=UPI00065406A7|nr:hypothetical protein [Caenimonas sp. SL110]